MRLLTRRSQARRERAVAGQMHLVAAELAAHVRAGRTLAQAIGDVAEDMPEPARSELAVAAAAIRLGMPPTEALARLRGGTDASVLASAVAVQLRVGGDLATLLDGLAEALVERDAQRRAAEVATAQARATARMVAAMPLGVGAGSGVDRLVCAGGAARFAPRPRLSGRLRGCNRGGSGGDRQAGRGGAVIRWLLLAACLVAAAEARAAWRRDRRLNGRDVRRVTHRLDVLVAAGHACRRLGLRCPAPPFRRDRLIERSGLGARLGEQDVDDARLGSTVTFASVGAAGLLLLQSPVGLVVAAGCAGFGWLYPDLWLRSAATRRANADRAAGAACDRPDRLGRGGGHLHRRGDPGAAASASGPLRAELEAVSANLVLGHRRAAELRDLGERTASPSLMRLATALRISDRLGVPLAAGLRRQAARTRTEQARAVQERAAKAAPRILLVVVFVLVPAAMLPVMTALALAASSSVGSFLAG